MKWAICLALLCSFTIHAQDFIESDQLDIDGALHTKKVTAADRMKKLREKLEAQNEALARKKIEQARIHQELILMKKLEQSFAENMDRMDRALK